MKIIFFLVHPSPSLRQNKALILLMLHYDLHYVHFSKLLVSINVCHCISTAALFHYFPVFMLQSESAQGEAAANAMAGRGRGGGFPGRGRGMRRR